MLFDHCFNLFFSTGLNFKINSDWLFHETNHTWIMTGHFITCVSTILVFFLVPKSIHTLHVSPIKKIEEENTYDFGRKVVVTSFKFVRIYGRIAAVDREILPSFPNSLISNPNCNVDLSTFKWQVRGEKRLFFVFTLFANFFNQSFNSRVFFN